MFTLAYFLKLFVISFLFSEVLCIAKCKYLISYLLNSTCILNMHQRLSQACIRNEREHVVPQNMSESVSLHMQLAFSSFNICKFVEFMFCFVLMLSGIFSLIS